MYKLKHIPTGLYYQPHKHGGSNLSKRGKIYQTNTHGLSSSFRMTKLNEGDPKYQVFYVYAEKNSLIHKQLKDILIWEECRHSYNQMQAETNLSDWIIEPIITK